MFKVSVTRAACVAAILAVPAAAQAGQVFFEGFESGTSGWSSGGSYGTVTQEPSGTAGISAFEGSSFANFQQTDAGAYTFFDGSRASYPGTYVAQTAVYLDTSWTAGSGFDYSMASYNSSGSHLRDYIFHVTQDTNTESLLIGGSNNTNFDPQEGLENGNHYAVGTSGWYIFQHVFNNVGGVLSVDLNLLDASLNTLFTQTLSNGADTIPAVAGGNGYAWFTNIDIDGGIYVDATSLNLPAEVPLPAGLPLLAGALGGIGLAARRRKQRG